MEFPGAGLGWPMRGTRERRSTRSTAGLRDELLNGWQFDSLLEARVHIEDWRIDYNNYRPHSAHGDLTPNEFAQVWPTRNQPALA